MWEWAGHIYHFSPGSNHASTHMSLYTFDMSLNKYGCYIANMNHWAIILYRHIDPTFVYISIKMQPTSLHTAYIIAKYVPKTKMPVKCHICQLVLVQISDNCVSIYTSYDATKSVTRSTAIHTVHIIGICSWKNMPTTSHMYTPSH